MDRQDLLVAEYGQALIDILHTLPQERIEQVVDFAPQHTNSIDCRLK